MNEAIAWLVAAVALFLSEILTPGIFFFAGLGLGALAAALAVSIGASSTVAWIIFFAASISSIYFIRPFARRYFGDTKKKSNVDALVGRVAPLMEKVAPDSPGLVKLDGELWKVSSQDTLETGERVEVVGVEGTHLVVKAKE